MAKLTPIHMIFGKQLSEVTGANEASKQIETLRNNGIPFILDAAGKPRILKEALLLLDRKPRVKESEKAQPNIPMLHKVK